MISLQQFINSLEVPMCSVLIAEPYRHGAMGSLGNARYMLIRQFRFPFKYSESDKIMSADHDRCFMWDREHAKRCFKEHTGRGELTFEYWAQSAKDEAIFAFLKDILKADSNIEWTGYRIMGTVNCSSGYPVWSLELFAKHPKSRTKVYTGEPAPNVRHDKSIIDYWNRLIE